MTYKKARLLATLTGISMMVFLTSNIAAVKLWALGPLSVDGGLLTFPISYAVGDLLVELFGEREANRVAIKAMLVNLVMILLLIAVVHLPPFPDWGGQEAFSEVIQFSLRVTGASFVAFVASSLVNNRVFARMKVRQAKSGARAFFSRAVLSSAVARVVDVAVFDLGAFLFVIPMRELALQIVAAYVLGMIVELMISPMTVKLREWLGVWLKN